MYWTSHMLSANSLGLFVVIITSIKSCSVLETNYLGFVISEEGMKPSEKKIEAIKSLPVPTGVSEGISFIGVWSYYRRFIPNVSQIAEPIIAFTRKYANYKWSDTHQRAFELLKGRLQLSGLVYPDSNKPNIFIQTLVTRV